MGTGCGSNRRWSEGTAPKAPSASAGLPGGHARAGGAAAGSSAAAKRQLRLSDGEILALFQSAQQEAAKEADWRGITSPAPVRDLPVAIQAVTGESLQRHGTAAPRGIGEDYKYLHELGHALRKPSHGLVSSTAGPGVACCAPIRVEALPGSALAEQQQQHEQQQQRQQQQHQRRQCADDNTDDAECAGRNRSALVTCGKQPLEGEK